MIRFIVLAALIALIYWAWRRTMNGGQAMSHSEAARLLDIAPDSDADTIIAAHKRVILRVHPDAGGNAELAARVNRARDIMLRSLSK